MDHLCCIGKKIPIGTVLTDGMKRLRIIRHGKNAIVDRIQRMVQRDKNRSCIVMWSMGNESAYGCNFEKALEWTKKFDSGRITQYESARYRNYSVTYDYHNLDIYSRMYPSLAEIEEYLEKDGSKPFLLVEYCHSMGNGPGDFEDYFQMIHRDDRMCAAVLSGSGATMQLQMARRKMAEPFTGMAAIVVKQFMTVISVWMDWCTPDRTPHTGLLEYKNVYRPVRVVSYDEKGGRLVLHNYMDFDDLKDYVEIDYEMTQDGRTVNKGTLADLSAAPHSDTETVLNLQIPERGKIFLKLRYRLKKGNPSFGAGL